MTLQKKLVAGYPPVIPAPDTLAALHDTMVGCTRCDLYLDRIRVVPGAGDPHARIFFVGEAPGAREDEMGVPFIGASGRLLDAMLAGAGISRADVFIANVVRCRPPSNRNPRSREIAACAGWLAEQLRLVSPRLVVPLGRFALQHFLPDAKITRLQATETRIHYAGNHLDIFPLLHPSAVLRNPNLREGYQAQFRALAALVPASGPNLTR
jgi:uracil-DNA glycosylase